MYKIAIFGGTFDPVSIEHIELVKNAIEELKLDKLIVMPTFISPHKKGKKISGANDRLNMAKLAFTGVDKVEVSDYEILKGDTSFTYLTIEYFKQLYKKVKIYLIVGSDMLLDFYNWKNPQIIISLATLVLARRARQIKNLKDEKIKFFKAFNCNFKVLKYIGGKISSTEIRTKCLLKEDARGLTADCVVDYINENNLYFCKFVDIVKSRMNEHRFRHTKGVVKFALKYAKLYNINEDSAFLAALLHDNAKYIDEKVVKEFKIDKSVPKPIIHQFLGEYLAKTEFNIQDEDILNAIKYHSSARKNMSNLEKLVFCSDILEENRDFKGVKGLRKIFDKSLDEGFKECLKYSYNYLLKSQNEIYPLTLEAYKYYKN